MRYSRATPGSTGLASLTVLAEDHTLMSQDSCPASASPCAGCGIDATRELIAGKASATPRAT
nr:hypothetical protein pJBCL41_00117 [Pseudomonas sp.]